MGKCPHAISHNKTSVEDIESPTIKSIRATFDRLNMDDRETVLLIILGHQYGRCHLDNSG